MEKEEYDADRHGAFDEEWEALAFSRDGEWQVCVNRKRGLIGNRATSDTLRFVTPFDVDFFENHLHEKLPADYFTKP